MSEANVCSEEEKLFNKHYKGIFNRVVLDEEMEAAKAYWRAQIRKEKNPGLKALSYLELGALKLSSITVRGWRPLLPLQHFLLYDPYTEIGKQDRARIYAKMKLSGFLDSDVKDTFIADTNKGKEDIKEAIQKWRKDINTIAQKLTQLQVDYQFVEEALDSAIAQTRRTFQALNQAQYPSFDLYLNSLKALENVQTPASQRQEALNPGNLVSEFKTLLNNTEKKAKPFLQLLYRTQNQFVTLDIKNALKYDLKEAEVLYLIRLLSLTQNQAALNRSVIYKKEYLENVLKLTPNEGLEKAQALYLIRLLSLTQKLSELIKPYKGLRANEVNYEKDLKGKTTEERKQNPKLLSAFLEYTATIAFQKEFGEDSTFQKEVEKRWNKHQQWEDHTTFQWGKGKPSFLQQLSFLLFSDTSKKRFLNLMKKKLFHLDELNEKYSDNRYSLKQLYSLRFQKNHLEHLLASNPQKQDNFNTAMQTKLDEINDALTRAENVLPSSEAAGFLKPRPDRKTVAKILSSPTRFDEVITVYHEAPSYKRLPLKGATAVLLPFALLAWPLEALYNFVNPVYNRNNGKETKKQPGSSSSDSTRRDYTSAKAKTDNPFYRKKIHRRKNL